MTDSLAAQPLVAEYVNDCTETGKTESCAQIAQVSNGNTAAMIRDRETVDATALAVYLRTVIGQFRISQPLAIELSRRFENLDRKRQVNGTYLEIDGARSLNAWLEAHEKQIGSKRNFYYVRDGGKRKPAPQLTDGADETEKKEDTPSDIFTTRVAEAREKLAEFQRQKDDARAAVLAGETVDYGAIEKSTDPNLTIWSLVSLVLAKIAPDGYGISQGDSGKFYLSKKNDDEPEPPSPHEKKAKRSAAAKKANATRAANKATEKPSPAAATPAASLGECAMCDSEPATVHVKRYDYLSQNYCADCATRIKKDDRRDLLREMSVPSLMGAYWTWKKLPKESKTEEDDEGNPFETASKRLYIETLKKDFLGNPKIYDQATVRALIAKKEAEFGE